MTEAPKLSSGQRRIVYTVAGFAVIIAAIGFAGSYDAVRTLAIGEGFGWFANVLPAGVDAGIGALLALDLLLTWLRIPYPLLRPAAWLLTAATIAFNGASAWPDPLGVGMHAIIPILFIIVAEAARHAIGRTADITADRHMESVRIARWLLAPLATFRLWRRMKLWELRSYDEVIALEQARLVYRTRLRARYGRAWRRKAPVEMVLPLRLARYGVPLDAPLPATPAATTKPTRSATAVKAATPALPAPATPAAPAATTVATAKPAPTTAVADAGRPYEPGTPQYVVHALWTELGHRPDGPAIVDALGAAGLPNSPQQARKIRLQVGRDNPGLPGLKAA